MKLLGSQESPEGSTHLTDATGSGDFIPEKNHYWTKGDHARFGELSLSDGPIGRTRKYRYPLYVFLA